MPNYVTVKAVVKGEQEEVQKCLSEIITEPKKVNNGSEDITVCGDFDFNNIVKIPEELVDTVSPTRIATQSEYDKLDEKGKERYILQSRSEELIKKYGFDNWYNWNVANWGSKWNALETSYTKGEDKFSFETAWSFPDIILKKLSSKYPKLTFEFEYANEDLGYGCGEVSFKNGETIYEFDRYDDILWCAILRYGEIEGKNIYEEMLRDEEDDYEDE